MVAELVETSRLWGRTAARDPAALGRAARRAPRQAHVLRAALGAQRAAGVVATERVTLYGLPIVAGRTVAYGAIDPELSRALFIRRALVEGDWDARHAFLAENRRLLEEVEALEQRVRRRDLLVDDAGALRLLRRAHPGATSSRGAHFDRWWRDARRADAGPADLHARAARRARRAASTRDALPRPVAPGRPRAARCPTASSPAPTDDGVTVHVPLRRCRAAARRRLRLARARPARRARHRAAARAAQGRCAARSCRCRRPRRRSLARARAAARGRSSTRVARELERAARRARGAGRLATRRACPPHLRMTLRVEDEDGAVLAAGRRPRRAARAGAAAAARGARRRRRRRSSAAACATWTIGDAAARRSRCPAPARRVRGYPALVDEGATRRRCACSRRRPRRPRRCAPAPAGCSR